MGFFTVRDEWTKCIGHRFLNAQICFWFGVLQLIICFWGSLQHFHSYFYYEKVIHCNFSLGFDPMIGVDVIIFDAGLLKALWGIDGCLAEYMDGGFGRLAWCLIHAVSLISSLPFACTEHPKPANLWPLLVLQSAYGIGLLILALSTLPRVLPVLMEAEKPAPLIPLAIYLIGSAANFFFLYVYWHWYWHVESIWNSVVKVPFGGRLENANKRSRRDKPRNDGNGLEEIEGITTIGIDAFDQAKPFTTQQQTITPTTRRRLLPSLPEEKLENLAERVEEMAELRETNICSSDYETPSTPESQVIPSVWPPAAIIADPVYSNSRENRRLRAPPEVQYAKTKRLPQRYHRRQRKQEPQVSNEQYEMESMRRLEAERFDLNLNPIHEAHRSTRAPSTSGTSTSDVWQRQASQEHHAPQLSHQNLTNLPYSPTDYDDSASEEVAIRLKHDATAYTPPYLTPPTSRKSPFFSLQQSRL
ncbi:unnamed protein product, partial [Mesorhabditis belari]|uniref:Uncharacterized protein n=1 Tax=Mesorhabditis belari TaxID=2138241 RepID=A0AAF3F6A5_9BILA